MTRTIDTGTDELLCTVEDRVATITLNKPQKRNALGDVLTPALRQALLETEDAPDVGCVVITGAGTAFCAGGDVSGMGSKAAVVRSTEGKIRSLQHKQDTLTLRLYELSKPTIAALPGPAAGAGLSIALACDLRVMAESAFVTTAFVNIGLSGDYGGSWLLNRLVGPALAKELYFTARRVTAPECLQWGLANRVVPFEMLHDSVRELASSIANGPTTALKFMKENLNRAGVADLRTCLAMEADRTVRLAATDEHREAVRAFMEKRSPRFSHEP